MKVINEAIRKKISMAIKNSQDISKLIEGYDLKYADLSGAIIKNISRINEDLQHCNFSYCTIGEKNKTVHFTGSNLDWCNFKGATCEGKAIFRRASVKHCNFSNSVFPNVEYQYADLTGSNFCNVVWLIGSVVGRKAKISKNVFDKWGIIVV